MNRTYCLDTSFFINGWSKHWRPDVFPSVWKKVGDVIVMRTAFSCEAVYDELKAKSDDLFQWAKQRRSSFIKPTEQITLQMAELMAKIPNFAAESNTRNAADPWVVALAIQKRAIVVTDEQPNATKQTKAPKIPNVCMEVGLRYMTPIDFLKDIGVNL